MSDIFDPLESGLRALSKGRGNLGRWMVLRAIEAALWLGWAASSQASPWALASLFLLFALVLEPALALESAPARVRIRWMLGSLVRWSAVFALAVGPGVTFFILGGSPEARVRWALVLLPLNLLSVAGAALLAASLALLPPRWAGGFDIRIPRFRVLLVHQMIIVAAELALAAVATTLAGSTWTRAEVLEGRVEELFVGEVTAIGIWRALGAPVAAWSMASRAVFLGAATASRGPEGRS